MVRESRSAFPLGRCGAVGNYPNVKFTICYMQRPFAGHVIRSYSDFKNEMNRIDNEMNRIDS